MTRSRRTLSLLIAGVVTAAAVVAAQPSGATPRPTIGTVPPPATTSTTTAPPNLAMTLKECDHWQYLVDNDSRRFASRAGCRFFVKGAITPDQFYAANKYLPRGAPGVLIAHQNIGGGGNGVNAFRVKYHSRSVEGKDIAVTGVVIIPRTPAPKGGWPILSVAHLTETTIQGCTDSYAPSKGWSHLADNVTFTDDHITAYTDYEGMGTPGPHPYLVGKSEARGVIDIVRAVRHIPDAHAQNRFVVEGHSQGGHAALFTAQIAKRYAPELSLLGAWVEAPATETYLFPYSIDTGLSTNYYFMMLTGFKAAHPAADFRQLFGALGATSLENSMTRCESEPNAGLTPSDRVGDPTVVEPWATYLRENNPGQVRTDVPIHMVQGTRDTTALKALNDILYARECALGQVVERELWDGADHSAVENSMTDQWFKDRFAGMPAPSSCPGKKYAAPAK